MEQHSRHLLFIHKQFPFGGAERVTLDIANNLCAHGWEVTVATSVHHVDDYPEGVPSLFHVVLLPHGNVKFAPRVACFLRHYIQQHDVCAFVSYRELLYANWLKRQTGAAFVFALQSMPFYEMSHAGWLSRWFYLQKYRRVYRAADAYGVLCEGHRSRLRAVMQQEADADKLYVLPNSVQAVDHIVWKKQPTILFVGRLSERDKRVDRLLRIWALVQDNLPEWRLRIVGDGPQRQALQVMAEQLHLQRTTFEGFTNHVQPYYDEASLLCMTSSFEGWPLVLAEAQANAVVPIVFNSFDAASEMIASPDEGVLVAPFNEQEYACQLMALVQDEDRLQRMQKAVVSKAGTYTIGRTAQAWIQLLNRITTL